MSHSLRHSIDPDQEGSIDLILGPMFSGKTSRLLELLRIWTVAIPREKATILIKYAKDVRYSSEKASTHDQITWDAVSASSLSEVDELVKDYDVIAVDEGQFFPDAIEYITKWADAGKKVIVAALDGTYQRKRWEILGLIPHCETVIKLTAVCMDCRKYKGAFTARTSNETEVEVIGGADKYVSLCRICYLRKHPNVTFVAPLVSHLI